MTATPELLLFTRAKTGVGANLIDGVDAMLAVIDTTAFATTAAQIAQAITLAQAGGRALSTGYFDQVTNLAALNPVAVSEADFDVMADTGVDNIVSLFTGTAYSSATKQITGAPTNNALTLTTAQQAGLITLVNALGSALVAAASAAVPAGSFPLAAANDYLVLGRYQFDLQIASLNGGAVQELSINQ